MPQTSSIRIVSQVQPSASGDFTSGGSVSIISDVYLENGTGANQSDRVAVDDRTLAGSTSEDLDLQTMTTTPDGSALGLVELRSITIKATSTNTGNLEISPGASNGFTGFLADPSDKLIIAPGTTFTLVCKQDGKYTLSGTNKVLAVSNVSSSSSSYTILAIGTSA